MELHPSKGAPTSRALILYQDPRLKLEDMHACYMDAFEDLQAANEGQALAIAQNNKILAAVHNAIGSGQKALAEEWLITLDFDVQAEWAAKSAATARRISCIRRQAFEVAAMHGEEKLIKKVRQWSARGARFLADPYEVLGLERGASPDEIKRAHRELMLRYHPDRNGGGSDVTDREFKRIQRAYEQLMD